MTVTYEAKTVKEVVSYVHEHRFDVWEYYKRQDLRTLEPIYGVRCFKFEEQKS